jgi:hypothetical protein
LKKNCVFLKSNTKTQSHKHTRRIQYNAYQKGVKTAPPAAPEPRNADVVVASSVPPIDAGALIAEARLAENAALQAQKGMCVMLVVVGDDICVVVLYDSVCVCEVFL